MHALQRFIRKLAQLFAALGILGGLAYLFWNIRPYFEKWIIRLQDRWQLYPYAAWIRQNERFTPPPPGGDPEPIRLATFLIVLSTQDRNAKANLDLTLEAIQKQIRPNWECIVILNDSASGLAEGWTADQRFIFQRQPGSINRDQAFLQALAQPTKGRWLVWTRAGDTHSERLLDYLAGVSSPVAYWDEDHLKNRQRANPFLKPDWSPELWLSIDLLYCSALQTDFIRKEATLASPGGLMAACVTATKDVRHIPVVLSHCQFAAWEDPNELGMHGEDVRRYLRARGIADVSVEQKPGGNLKVWWPAGTDKVSIVIPNRNSYTLLRQCVQSILQTTRYEHYELIIVDDDSQDPDVQAYYRTLAGEKKEIRVVAGTGPFNFSAACNLGAREARGRYLLFLNNDTQAVQAEWLSELVLFASQPEIGVVGPKLVYPDRTVQHAGIVVGLEGHASHVFMGAAEGLETPHGRMDWYRNYSAITGACMLLRKGVFESIGGFDEHYSLAFSDVEICLRAIQNGYRVVYTPESVLIHHEGRSRGRLIPAGDKQLALHQFSKLIEAGDPYYNPGLSLAWRIPTLRRAWEQSPLQRVQSITLH
jgi:GT2 family glycosyltransferase